MSEFPHSLGLSVNWTVITFRYMEFFVVLGSVVKIKNLYLRIVCVLLERESSYFKYVPFSVNLPLRKETSLTSSSVVGESYLKCLQIWSIMSWSLVREWTPVSATLTRHLPFPDSGSKVQVLTLTVGSVSVPLGLFFFLVASGLVSRAQAVGSVRFTSSGNLRCANTSSTSLRCATVQIWG